MREIRIYYFDELSPKAQDVARVQLRKVFVDVEGVLDENDWIEFTEDGEPYTDLREIPDGYDFANHEGVSYKTKGGKYI